MKTSTENGNAITQAMDWLGQLREEDYAEPAFGSEPAGTGEPASASERASASEPPAAGPRPAVPAARPPVPGSGWPDAVPEPPAVPEAAVPEPAVPELPVPELPVPELSVPAPAAPDLSVPATRWSAAVRGRHAAVAAPPVPLAAPPVPAPAPAASWPVAAAGPAAISAVRPLAAPVPAAEPVSLGGEDPRPAERAPIGDELRIPRAWCEMGSCISHYADPAALGEVDNRSRAITAGWRMDALGRLACPQCLQGPWFWATQQLAVWDRSQAVAMATLMTAVVHAADYRVPAVAAQPAMIPPVEQALAPLPPHDRG